MLYLCGIKVLKIMQSIPSRRTQKNIANFAIEWSEGNLGSGAKVKAKAQRYLNLYRDWIYENLPYDYSRIVGCIEWHNFHEL